nr:regulatory protein GemA [Plastoroseomonas hellenica]
MEEESYRAMLKRVTGKRSAAELTDIELEKVLAEFRRLGFKGKPTARSAGKSAHPQLRMIHALWQEIGPLLAVPFDQQALRSFVERQTKSPDHPNGISAPEFLRGEDANRVIEGLKAWLQRLKRQRAGVTYGHRRR